MSLIIETLNKMESEEFKSYVPPFFQKDNNIKKKYFPKKAYIYAGLLVSLSFPSLYFANLIESSQQNFGERTVIINEERPVPVAQDISKVSKPEIVLNEKVEINFLEKELNQLENLQIPNSVVLSVQNEIANISIPKIKMEKSKSPQNLDLEFNSFVSMADNFYNEKDFENSIKWYQKAFQIKKDNYVLNRLLILNYQQKNWEDINALLPELKDEQTIYSFLLNLINDNQITFAKEILNKKINLDKNGYLFYLNGMIFENEGDLLQAENSYKKAFEKNSTDPYLSYSYGRILEINKKYSQALNIYLQTEKLDLDNQLKTIIQQRISILRGSLVF